MIPHAEVLALRGEWSLRADVIEKDYVLGWMLAVIAEARVPTPSSGTCEYDRRTGTLLQVRLPIATYSPSTRSEVEFDV